jgi:hypothetical protein
MRFRVSAATAAGPSLLLCSGRRSLGSLADSRGNELGRDGMPAAPTISEKNDGADNVGVPEASITLPSRPECAPVLTPDRLDSGHFPGLS